MVCLMSVAIVVGIAAPALAYPPKSHFTDDHAYWGCEKESNPGYHVMIDFKRDDTYTEDNHGFSGRYRYLRDKGRINFRSGGLDALFLKISTFHNGTVQSYRMKRKSNGSLWGYCHPVNPS